MSFVANIYSKAVIVQRVVLVENADWSGDLIHHPRQPVAGNSEELLDRSSEPFFVGQLPKTSNPNRVMGVSRAICVAGRSPSTPLQT